MALLEAPESVVESFYNSLREKFTLGNYKYGIHRILGYDTIVPIHPTSATPFAHSFSNEM